MTDDKFKTKTLIYCGKRLGRNNQLFECFARGDAPEDELLYKTSRRCVWGVGQKYTGKITDAGRIDFSSLEDIGETVDETTIEMWSAEDAVARRAKQNESARKKVATERREAWLFALEPLRIQYKQMSFPQRRAMRQLIVEWLDQ